MESELWWAQNRRAVILACIACLLLGGGVSASLTASVYNRQFARDVQTMAEQNARLEQLVRERAEWAERLSGITMIYGPETADVTDRLPAGLRKFLGGQGVRVHIVFPDRPPRTLMFLPGKIEPASYAGNPYLYAWAAPGSGVSIAPQPVGTATHVFSPGLGNQP